MGIRTDPGYSLFGNNHLACWPPGQTPKKLYVSISGIMADPNHVKFGFDPPNGIWTLEQDPFSETDWYSIPNAPGMNYWSYGDYSGFDIILDAWTFVFSGSGPLCSRFFSSTVPEPAAYWGGTCFISPRPLIDDQPTLQSVMSLLNIEPTKQTFAEVFPVDANHAVYKYNRKSDKTNILLKIDHRLF